MVQTVLEYLLAVGKHTPEYLSEPQPSLSSETLSGARSAGPDGAGVGLLCLPQL